MNVALDAFLISFAVAAGAATFFSPCSVGLFPAYVGYFLASGGEGSVAEGRGGDGSASSRATPFSDKFFEGIRLGGLAALGFFALFLAIGSLVSVAGTKLLGPYLRWISIGIGAAIIVLGLLLASGTFPSLHLNVRAPRSRTPASVFTFGIGYGLASLGCTLPVFLTTILASLAAGGPWAAFLVLLAYASGMGLVMVTITVALAVSENATRTYVRRIVPHVQRASAGLMALAGGVVIYFYAVVWR